MINLPNKRNWNARGWKQCFYFLQNIKLANAWQWQPPRAIHRGEQIQCNTTRNYTKRISSFFAHLSASGGRKSYRKRQQSTISYVWNSLYTLFLVAHVPKPSDTSTLMSNRVLMIPKFCLWVCRQTARFVFPSLPRTMFFSNDLRQV